MKNRHCGVAQCVLPGLLLMILLNGCSALERHSRTGTPDHAFIVYWPPPENSKQLRLAVKDLIDMKGVVTTAGSEYVATTSPPASQDAKCLELARERKVTILGKKNLP
jgi:amidase